MHIIRIAALLMVPLILAGNLFASMKPGEQAPDFELKDASGETHRLSDYLGSTVVLEWINYGCPFVRKHYDSGNMQALQKEYVGQGVIWLAICSSAPGKQGHMKSAAIASKNSSEKAQFTAYLLDEDGEVGRMYEAKTTPHMFVINTKGEIAYEGAIDDRPGYKKADVEGAHNYVRAALEAVLKNEAPKVQQTRPYGCSVKY